MALRVEILRCDENPLVVGLVGEVIGGDFLPFTDPGKEMMWAEVMLPGGDCLLLRVCDMRMVRPARMESSAESLP